jgi:hypothetical protein
MMLHGDRRGGEGKERSLMDLSDYFQRMYIVRLGEGRGGRGSGLRW